ncbi:MAG: type 4a pilus biogenesis protein PilO [Patescibacteria group bacterium]|nr:type 4a pilus biogenesis protein PilO [Patescibacteria group bacterium]
MKFGSRLNTSRDYNKYIKRLQQLSLNPVAKVSGIISLTIFTVAFFGIFAILPTFKTVGSLSKEIKDIKEINQKLSLKIKALGSAEDIYSQVVNDLELVNKMLPETASFDRLVWQIEWLAMNTEIELSSANFGEFQIVGPEIIENDLGKIEVELTLVGGYSQIKYFVKKLNRIDRLISINDVRIANKSFLKKDNDVSANIKFNAYYLTSDINNL